jgi:anti-anti-sigma factor
MNENPIVSLVSVEKDGCIRVASRGNITAAEMTLGPRNPLEALVGENWPCNRIILDLSKTDFIDSTAIAWLISTSKQFRANGGSFAIHSIVPRVRQMLDLLKIGRIIPIVSDENAARKMFSGGHAAQAA